MRPDAEKSKIQNLVAPRGQNFNFEFCKEGSSSARRARRDDGDDSDRRQLRPDVAKFKIQNLAASAAKFDFLNFEERFIFNLISRTIHFFQHCVLTSKIEST